MDFDKDPTLQEWTREQPLSVLALDSADRAVLRIADERDAVQKKTFTKWVNKHLKKARRQIRDLFEDLRDGHNLISLLEVLTGEQLPRERGQMRFHMLHNIDTALHFLRCKNVKLVNIRSEDIVDGNPKLTLGLIWTIILHFQISDIVIGQEPNVSAKDYLLRWAKRTTHKYPGVSVTDFTKSWRDGLAFSSILHRNRPDLVDWRQARQQRPRERMEHAFYVAEREYGVTRLLDPEDVDTHNPDEKSLITYISSLHEVFPEPPPIHPLFDTAAQQRVQEYREIASSLQMWIREKYSLMQDHLFPSTLIEMKKLAAESSRFRTDEVPPRQKDKAYCAQLFKDLEKYFKSVGEVDVEPELHFDNIERNWQRLMVAYQERDRRILEEIKRLEKLQMLAEKVHREIKQTDSNLDSIEHAIENESRRIKRIHPLEAKKIADQIDQDLAVTERNIQSLKGDVSTLRNGRYPQSSELDKRVNKLHERWVHLRHMLHNKIVGPLANMSFPVEERTVTKHIRTVQETRNVETNPHFRSLQEHIEWCKNKLKQLKKADFGTDLPSVQTERDLHHREHKQIDHFHSTIETCTKARQYFNGEELVLYDQHLGQLQKIYAELLSFSTTRMTDLDSLLDFIQLATNELHWLNDKEETEVKRDWSDVKLDVQAVEKYFERLMSILEDHEFQFNSVLEKGENLVLQNHPATKAIEAHMAAMNAQWAWLLQLTHCLETHLQNTRVYQQFFKDIQVAEEWLKEKDEVMNSEFSQGEFSLDVGERLLEGMQALRDELNTFGDQVQALTARSQDIVPLKQRTQPITRPMIVNAICNYKQNNFVIEKGKECTLTDNSGRTKWRVHNSKGIEAQVPGVCFVIPPPDKEALDAAERLRRQYDRSIALWQKKQLRMRQNMIFATIKVVKGWDLPQFIAIGAEQRNTIRKALNEDADKLMAEGDPSDPQLRRLRREMDEVNRLFDEFEKRARAEEESKNQTRIFNNQIMHLLRTLEEAEIVINQRVMSPLPRDIDTLQHLVLEHKEFESRLQNLEPEIEQVKDTFRSITLKTPQHKKDLEKVLDKWKYIWNTSNVYIERLKCVEIVLNGMEDASQVISEFENKLALFKELPGTREGLEEVHDDLLRLESAVGQQQIVMDQLNDDFDNTRRLTEKSRPSQRSSHADVERLDKEVQKLNNRWSNVCAQLADRLRGCKQAYDLLNKYREAKEVEDGWLDEQYGRLENLHPIKERAKEHLDLTKNLLNSIVERTPKIEHVNISGGKFIREGKIWSKGAQRFREALLEAQPSLDASTSFQAPDSNGGGGADLVAVELDEFNARFQYLLDALYGRLREIAERCKGDIVTLRLVEQMQPQPFRTFRTEFHMSSTNEHSSTFTTTTHYSKQYIHTSKSSRTENGSVIRVYDETDSVSNGRPVPDKHTTFTHIIQEPPLDLRSLDDDVTGLPGIVNPFTGAYVTISEAIQQRILDVRTGKLLVSPDGRQVSVEEAREAKLIDPSVAEKLQSPCGVKENGRHLTLLEAIQRKIHEAEQGFVDPAQRIKVTTTATHSVSLNQAIDDGRVDLSSGTYTLENGERIDIKEAYRKGYLLQHTEVKLHTGAITLSDAISQGLIDEKTGWIIDRNSGNKYQIDAAVKCNVIDSDTREVVDARTDDKVSVIQAIDRGIINPKLGRYLSGHEKITFGEAKQRQRIVKPKSIKELVDEHLIDEHNGILSPTHQTRLTLLEAVSRAVVDYDTIKSILDIETDEYLTLSEALAKGIVTADGKFKNSVTGETLSFRDAVERGYIISVIKKSIFDVDGFQPPDKSDHISFNAANAKGYISRKQGGSLLASKSTGKLIPFVEALNSGEVKPEVYEKLARPIGIFEDGKELTVLDAVFKGYIDPKTGNLIDLTNNKVVYLNDAIARHLITPEGASMLNSLLNLNVSTRITRTLVQRYVTVTSKSPSQGAMTYTEALRLGLVNNESQSYTDPSTKETIPIVQAISEGRLAPDTENSEKTIKIISTGTYNELPPEGWDLVEAIDRQLYDPTNGLFVIHGTDRLVSFEECLNLKLINPASAAVIDPVTRRKITMTRAVEKKILDATGHYHTVDGGKLTMAEAIKNGVVLLDDKPTHQLPSTTIDLDDGNLSEAQKTRARITIEPTYKVKIGRAQSVSPEREAKRVVLQRLRRKVLRPKDAITSGLIDEDTARLLESGTTTVGGERLTLQEALEGKKIDGSSGRIVDPQRGDVLSIDEAIVRGILNPDGTNELLVPLNRSLSVPELFEQGLVDVDRKGIIHPETGACLSISDAIVCDIVDPLSTLVKGTGEEITLAEALDTGVLNQEDFTIETRNLQEALEVFGKPKATPLPPVGMTLPVAIERGLVNPDSQSVTHPITKAIIPLNEAIESDLIMNIPFPPETDAVKLNDALDNKLIDETSATFKYPKTGQLLPIKEAVEKGLLIVKEPTGDEATAPVTTVTETVDTIHTVTTRTIEISVGYALLNKNEVQNLETGQIIPIEEAVKRGIVKDINETKNRTILKDIKMNFSEALNKGLVDMNAGTFTDPDSGQKVPIKQALEDGTLLAVPETASDKVKTELNIAEAFESIYDDSLDKFKDPSDEQRHLSFKEAVESEIIDPNSMIYDVHSQKPVTVEQAIEKGLIDPNSGKIVDSESGETFDFKQATKKGLIAVLGGLALPVLAPVAAGVATAKAVKEFVEKKKKRGDDEAAAAAVYSQKDLKPVKLPKQEDVIVTLDYEEPDGGEAIVLPLAEAITLNKIEPKICRILYQNKELPYTVQDGLEQHRLAPSDHVQILTNHRVVLQPHRTFVTVVSKHLTPQKLSELGFYDPKSRVFVDPRTGAPITFRQMAYECGVFDPSTVLVKDLTTKPPTYVTLDEALERGLIDPKSGYIVDPKTGKRVHFFEAMKIRWIINAEDKPKEKFKPLTLLEAVRLDGFDRNDVTLSVNDEKVPLIKAIQNNVVDGKSVTVRDPKNMQLVPYYEAVDKSIVDPQRGLVVNTANQKVITFPDAFLQGYVLSIPQPISLQAVVHKGIYDPGSYRIRDPLTGQLLTVSEAVDRQIVDDKISEVKDTKANVFVTLEESLKSDLVANGEVRDTSTGELVPLHDALSRHMMQTKPVVFSLLQTILQNYYCPHTGLILNPITGEEVTLRRAIDCKLIDPVTTRIKDDRRGRIVEINEAIQNGLVDAERGLLTNPPLPLDQAYFKGYILSTVLPWSLQETLAQKVYDFKTGRFTIDDAKLTLAQAIEAGIINPNVLTIKDPRSDDIITLNEAIRAELIDPVEGQAVDPVTNASMNLYEAYDHGLVVPYKSQITLPEAVFKGFYDPSTGKFINPKNKERLKTSSAINRGYVDVSSTLVTIDEEVVTFERAVIEGIIDTNSGTLTSYDESLDFGEAFERGLLTEIRTPVPLSEAIAKGIYDGESQLFLDPQTDQYLTLIEAIEVNLIDAESVSVKDTRLGTWRKLSLIDAIHNNYVNGNTGLVRDFSKGDNYEVTLEKAFDAGILVDNRAAISLQRAIHQGLYDEGTGKIIDPDTERKVTLHEAIRNFRVNPLLPCYFDKKHARLYNLTDSCRLGVIDKLKGTFRDLESDEVVPLSKALDAGFIVDIETANFGLYEALEMGLYYPEEGLFVHPSNGQKCNLRDAVDSELINPLTSIIKNTKENKYVPLPIAVESKLIDEELSVYRYPHGKTIDLSEAMRKGLIVTARRGLTVEEAIRNSLYRPETGKFVDPLNGEFYTLRQAIDSGLIDPRTTALVGPGGSTKSILSAVEVDFEKARVSDTKSKKTLGLDEAFKRGVLVTLSGKPLVETTEEAGVQRKQSSREYLLEEAIKLGLIDPTKAVVKDPKTGRFVDVKSAIEEQQLDPSKLVTFDETATIGPVVYDHTTTIYLEEPRSFIQAIEDGLLNVDTGKFNGSLTLRDSITSGLIDPDSVLVKDSSKRKLVKLPEAFRKGLVDADKANVLDSNTSKLHTLASALETGLLTTPNRGFTLIEGIKYGLYNPTTGRFSDPFLTTSIIDRKRYTLEEAIEGNLIDPSGVVVKDPATGGVATLTRAVDSGLVDAIEGHVLDGERRVDLLRSYEAGWILPAEKRRQVHPRSIIIYCAVSAIACK